MTSDLVRFTRFANHDQMSEILDDLIETVNSPDVPVFCCRFVALDGGVADFAMTDMELLIVDSELYGVEQALKSTIEHYVPVAGGSKRWTT